LGKIAEDFDALLMVDEAHATGVLGSRGMGLACEKRVDLAMGTFGKACGSFGAYVACSREMRDYLINTCSGFIYSTAMPPSVAGSIDAALELIPGMERERLELQSHAQLFRNTLQEMGWDTGTSTTQIVPVIVGEEREAVSVSDRLRKGGILASALRPPTVGSGRSSIRFGLTALHTDQDLKMVVDRLRLLRKEDGLAVS
jgi:8-amino-7-oxononanoate synthase